VSLPLNTITPAPVLAPFIGPLESWTYTPLREQVLGGTAIGNGEAGRMVKGWEISYVDGVIIINPVNGAPEFTLPIADVLSVSLAFDSNMAVAIAFQTAAGANLYFYSTLTASYDIYTIPGATSCRACVDDPRKFNEGASDVLFGYVLGNVLYYRQQRDRYAVPRLVGPALGSYLSKMGATEGFRVKFELRKEI
jgi:hypothetical protein